MSLLQCVSPEGVGDDYTVRTKLASWILNYDKYSITIYEEVSSYSKQIVK